MIPKIIHYCWISGDEFPEKVKRYLATWKENLPDYAFVLWNYNKIVTEAHGFNENLWLKQSIETKNYAFAADYIRAFALNRYGGIYLDTDVEILASFDPFLKNDLFMGFDYGNDLEPAVMGAVPGHPWIVKTLEYYRDKPFVNKNGSRNNRPLPSIFDQTSRELFSYRASGELQKVEKYGITLYPYDYFSPRNVYFNKIRKSKNTVAVHHFEGNWVEKDYRYYLKKNLHRGLYLIGGKSLHDLVVRKIRKLAVTQRR